MTYGIQMGEAEFIASAETEKLRKALTAANRGAKTNAEINKRLVAENAALRAKLQEAVEVVRPFAACVKTSGASSWVAGSPSPSYLRRAAALLASLETEKAPDGAKEG